MRSSLTCCLLLPGTSNNNKRSVRQESVIADDDSGRRTARDLRNLYQKHSCGSLASASTEVFESSGGRVVGPSPLFFTVQTRRPLSTMHHHQFNLLAASYATVPPILR